MARLPVQIKFTVLDQATKNIEGIGRSFRKASKDIDAVNSAAGKAGSRLDMLGKKMSAIGGAAAVVGASMTAAITLPIIGAGKAIVDGGIKFQEAQNKMAAATGATAEEVKLLQERAMELGNKGRFGAAAITESMEALGKSGMKASDVAKSVEASMALAQIEGMGMADSADFLTDTLTVFNLKADQAARVVDVMVKASGESSIGLRDLQNSMKYAALGASSLGIKVDDVASAIAALGKLGIKGEMGGTTLRNFFTSISARTRSIEALKEAGVQASDIFAKDAFGKLDPKQLRPISEILERLNSYKLTPIQMNKIFGTEFAMSTGRAIEGFKMFQDMAKEVGPNAAGAAQERIGKLNQGVSAALDNLAAKWENLSIKLSQSGALEGIEKIIRRIGDLLDWFGNLDPGVQKTILTVAGFAAVLGPVIAALSLFAVVGAQVSTAMGVLGITFGGVGAAIGTALGTFLPWTAAIVGSIALVSDLIKNWSEFKVFIGNIFDEPMLAWKKAFYWLETRLGWLRDIMGNVIPGLKMMKFDAAGFEKEQKNPWNLPEEGLKNQPITPFANPEQWMKEFNRRQESKVVVDFKNVPKGLEVTTTQVAGSDVPLPIGRTKNVAGRNMRAEMGGRGR